MTMRYLSTLTIAVLLFGSCGKETAREAESGKAAICELEFTRFAWEMPLEADLVYGGPTLAAMVSGEMMVFLYVARDQAGDFNSAVSLVQLSTGDHRYVTFPFRAAVKHISTEELAVKPGFGPEAETAAWEFLDVNSLVKRMRPKIPHGSYGHARSVDVVYTGRHYENIWFHDRATKREYTLPASRHSLAKQVTLKLASDRVVVTGRSDHGTDDFWLPHTQLWSFPDLQKLAELQAPFECKWIVRPYIFGDLFAYPLAPGTWQIASLRDGKSRFVVGQDPPEGNTPDGGGRILFCEDNSEYVGETGVILTIERLSDSTVTLNAYSISAGKKVRTIEMESETLDGLQVQMTKIGDEWTLFEERRDPRDDAEKERCMMHFIAYRIGDFKKMGEPITVRWDCLLNPIIDSGRIIIPGKDHVLIADLSGAVTFDED